ncbi:unnamed protein product [marine sediment metagenome]|uniref:Uncharacterized protein n=1 Tax=marine sediment metagenome TaxID=412755 RepID=X0TLS7_9ZZZZ
MAWQTDSYVNPVMWEIGVVAVRVLGVDALRAGYRVINLNANGGTIYHDYTNMVSVLSPDFIMPGGWLEDVGEWQTVHHGEVWLLSDIVGQDVRVEEIVANEKPPGWEPKPKEWWRL